MFFIKLVVLEGALIIALRATSLYFDPYTTPLFFISPLIAFAISYVMQRRDLFSMGTVALRNSKGRKGRSFCCLSCVWEYQA